MSSSMERLKGRVETLEKVQTDGIDWLANEVKNLFQNDKVIAGGLESQDNTVAAIRALLVEKGILTDPEIDAKTQEVEDLRTKAIQRKEEELKQKLELEKMTSAAKANQRPC